MIKLPKACNTVLFTTITGAEIQIVLKIYLLLFDNFGFVVVYAKTIIHLSIGE
jgi:hypothetical protein